MFLPVDVMPHNIFFPHAKPVTAAMPFNPAAAVMSPVTHKPEAATATAPVICKQETAPAT